MIRVCEYVLKKFVEFGAPSEILHRAKPHIGTDNLRNIVKNIRERIALNGGTIRFGTTLEETLFSGGALSGVKASG